MSNFEEFYKSLPLKSQLDFANIIVAVEEKILKKKDLNVNDISTFFSDNKSLFNNDVYIVIKELITYTFNENPEIIDDKSVLVMLALLNIIKIYREFPSDMIELLTKKMNKRKLKNVSQLVNMFEKMNVTKHDKPDPIKPSDDELPPDWVKYETPSGEIAYYNNKTEETSWEKPTKPTKPTKKWSVSTPSYLKKDGKRKSRSSKKRKSKKR
jgi:hypothetical protein